MDVPNTDKAIRANRCNGPFLVFIAAVIWSFAGVGSKYVHWSAMSIACMRGIIAALTIGFINRQWTFRPTRPVLLGAICTFGTSVLFMTSIKMTTAANAIVLQYTAPAFVIIISALFLRERFCRIDVTTVIITFLGISLFFIDHIGHGALIGDLLAILSGVTFGGVFLANHLPGANPIQASYLGCFMHILLLPFFFFDTAVWAFDITEWITMIFMGIFQMGIAYMLFSKGIRHTSAFSASIICTIEPILNPIWVFLWMGEKPGTLSIIGACTVVLTITVHNIITIGKTNKM